MKIYRLTFCLMAVCVTMLGHAESSIEAPLDMAAERERISQQRAEVEAVFVTTQKACYARFTVSDCLSQANRRRRAALEPLRRQEVRLNDLDRQAKALAQSQRVQRNVTSQNKQSEADPAMNLSGQRGGAANPIPLPAAQ